MRCLASDTALNLPNLPDRSLLYFNVARLSRHVTLTYQLMRLA